MSRELRIGDHLRDNDPRMPGRILEIVGFNGSGRAVCRDWSGKRSMIGLHRICTDGKSRRSGFNLVEIAS